MPENFVRETGWEGTLPECEKQRARTVIDGTDISHYKSDKGIKHDQDKLPLHLLPVDALEAITEILQFGAVKYSPRNWEKGMDWSRVYRATLSHLFKWWRGEATDEETGKSHLWHAGCCILFLIAYELRGVGKDDRP
jgi:hypothetical protein